MNSQIQKQLEQIAFNRSEPFCYGCYQEAPEGRCHCCGSDDLMRLVVGVGCEYGTDWIIQHILETELTAVDLEAQFEESVRQCYAEETKVGWMTFDTVTLMKEQDPVSWQCGLFEYIHQEESEGNIFSVDNGVNYFLSHDLENFVQMNLEIK